MSQGSRPSIVGGEHLPGRRILVAEDDLEMRRVVADALRRAGYEVIEACDGMELSDRLVRAPISGSSFDCGLDLIVTDVRMPGGNGLDILEVCPESAGQTPVIVMTAFGDNETRSRAERLGAVVLDKPFRMDHLVQTVRKLLI